MMLSPKTTPTPTILRLVYENGVFRPVQPVDYQDGQEINVSVLSAREQSRLLLGDLLEPIPEDSDVDAMDEQAMMARLHASFKEGTTLSDSVFEDREERV